MIQGQFDAATKLDAPKPHGPTAAEGQRPWKRRRTSPPIEDSINVVDPSETRRPKSPEQVSPAKNIAIRAANTSRDGSLPKYPDPVGLEHDDESYEDPPSKSDQAPLSHNDDLSNAVVCTTSSRTGAEAPGPPPNADSLESEPEQDSQAVPGAASSSASSQRQSPAPGPRTCERVSRLPRGSKILHPLSPSRVASPGPSTPKPSPSETTTNNASSPLSSPPPELFDPYDDQSTEPPPSGSSRPSSPVSDDEQQSNNSDEDGSALFQERVNRSRTLRRSLSTLKGRELFDASIWADPLKTSVFYTFATNLRQKSKDAAPTGCHEFISHLSSAGKMVRCYTQNIDLLEDKVGLSTRLLLGPGSRSRFSTRLSKGATGTTTPRNLNSDGPCISSQAPVVPEQTAKEEPKLLDAADCQQIPSRLATSVEFDQQEKKPGCHDATEDYPGPGQDQGQEADKTSIGVQPVSKPVSNQATPGHDKGVECVFLHGSLRSLRCFQCGCVADWDEGNREDLTLSGEQPPCPRCEDATAARQERGKRALGVGKLRPDIVLYGEEHPESQRISTIIQHDISLAPDMLIVMGTSLKVHGLKTVVREFAKAVHNKKDGKVIFINYTKPAESVWADIIDFWVEMDCDAWVQDLKAKKPVIWLPPGSVDDEPRSSTKRRRTIKDEADKQSKKAKNTEQLTDGAPIKEDKKKSAKMLAEAKPPDIKKPEPKRPACFRDCKHNGAHWTIKILSTLAKLSGRKEEPFFIPSSFKPVSAPRADNAAAATPDLVATQKAAGPQHPSQTRRGPRTRNTKSRKMPGDTSAAPKTRTKPPKKTTNSNEPGTSASDTPAASVSPDESEVARSRVSLGSAMPAATTGFESTAVNMEPVDVPDDTILAEMPIPNVGPKTGLDGQSTSIVASVKSNHRVRKPKKMFGEPASETSSTSTGGSSKSKSKNTPQAKKTKSNAKSQKGKGGRQGLLEAADEISLISSNEPAPSVLPAYQPPISAVAAAAAAAEPGSPRRQETPVESYYTLPPLQQDNIRRQPRHNLPPIDVGPDFAAYRARPPPDTLEPIVVPGPPTAISPTTLSPQHWRKRAFQYGDPLSGHFESHYGQGPPPQGADSFLTQSGMSGRQQQQTPLLDRQHGVSDASSWVVTSQQLDRESREAAAALSDLRGQAGYDNRHFAIMPEGP